MSVVNKMTAAVAQLSNQAPIRPRPHARRTLIVACLAHALHDGYTDLIYVLLPVWQAEFGLGYGMVALLRGVYAGSMAGLQIPAGRLAQRIGGRTLLAAGTALAAIGYGLAGFSGGLLALFAALALSGAGSSTQHPIASAAVSRAYGRQSRGPLGTYNFSGDLGKAAIPACLGLLLTLMPWRTSLRLLAAFGLLVAALIAFKLPSTRPAAPEPAAKSATGGKRGGFPLLFAIGVLDTGVRMGLLTFLPFLLKAKGATLPTVGLALSLVFIGGAAGKFTCGWLGARVGVLATVLFTEGGTAAAILTVLVLPLAPTLFLLPLLGIMLNGTSSVLYGTVPELVCQNRTEHAFALFYTGTIGSGAIAPVLYGVLGDAIGANWATAATAITALATFPLALTLAPRLASR
jgi:MFS family permease